jgi:hypothetical protein
MEIRMRMRPKTPASDSPTTVPFGCASEDCGRDVAADTAGAGIIKEGKELDEGRGMGDTDV